MASNYGLAAQCQLRRDELHELLTLSAVATQADGGGSGTSNGNAVLPLWRTLLTAAHVRALVLHALVRVSVPKSKQQLLIRGNKYTNAGGGAGASAENNNHHQQQQVYRVGQIVALVPRPRASSEAAPTAGETPAGAQLSDWLLGINFGEVTELLGAKYISNDAFNAEEHAVYVRSCLSARSDATAPLMTAAVADVVARNIQDVRRFAAAVVAERNGGAAAAASGARGGVSGAVGYKRPRDDSGALGEGTDKDNNNGSSSDDDDDVVVDGVDVSVVRARLLAERAAHRKERRQWEALRNEQQRHLSGLRQLLNSKNSEMQRVLHAQRQAETEHRTAVEQWRNKTEEQGQAMRRTERALAEERAAQQERREKTDMLVAQLKKLAEQTRRFKEVTDTLAEWLHMSTRQPEEVLARLKEKMAEEHP